jgi:hypothetical protein
MRPFGFTVSLVATLALAVVVANCSSDVGANDPLAAPDDAGSLLGNMSYAGGGWSPVIEAASNDKVSVCHSGNGKHYVQLNLSAQGARAHLGDPNTGRGGHPNDYRVSPTTQCPPPANPGQVQICKVAGTGVTAGTNYSFTVTPTGGQPATVTVAAGAGPTGTCASAGSFSIGTAVEVRETAQQGVTTSSIVVTPIGAQQGTSDLAGRSAVVIAGTGMTTLTFTNTNATAGGPTGTLSICKVAGTGVTAGTNYTFGVAGQTATVAAGAGPTGTCTAAPLTVAAGNVTVTENATTGIGVSAVTATATGGANALVSSDFAARSATVTVTAGQLTTVTFTNSTAPAATGTLVICKIGGNGITAGTNFTFTAGGQTAVVAAGAAPNGTCGNALTLPAGAVTVTESAAAGTSVSAIAGTPATPTNINLASRSATVQITAGQETRITFTNTAP